MRVCLIALLGLAVLAPTAAALTLVRPDGTSATRYQRWADSALVPTAPGDVMIRVEYGYPPECDGLGSACTDGNGIYADKRWFDRATLLHELGHIFDYRILTDSDRRRFIRLTHDDRDWRSPPNSPHERFAMAYSLCARKLFLMRRLRSTGFGYDPTPRQHARVCGLIRWVYEPVSSGT